MWKRGEGDSGPANQVIVNRYGLGLRFQVRRHNLPINLSGTMQVPLSSSDRLPAGLGLPFVTAVFCMVDGGKEYLSKYRSEAKQVNAELVTVMHNALRQVSMSAKYMSNRITDPCITGST